MTFSAKILIRWEKVSLIRYYETGFVFHKPETVQKYPLYGFCFFLNQSAIQELKLFSECFFPAFSVDVSYFLSQIRKNKIHYQLTIIALEIKAASS